MSNISGPDSSNEMQRYKTDFQNGAKLLKQASNEYFQTTEVHKKKQIEKAMNETILAMNQILKNVLKTESSKLENKIQTDYKNFISNPQPDTMNQLNNDVANIQNSL